MLNIKFLFRADSDDNITYIESIVFAQVRKFKIHQTLFRDKILLTYTTHIFSLMARQYKKKVNKKRNT